MRRSYFLENSLRMKISKLLAIMQNNIISRTTYFGVRTIKNPNDAWIYQEIIFETKPDVIIEIGNASGGGLLYLAHICDVLSNGMVIGIDINHNKVPECVKKHPRISLITGDACKSFSEIQKLIKKEDKVLIIEDSAHTYENTLNVLKTYSVLTPINGYFIVEDSICHHGLNLGPSPGPYEAIEAFLKENTNFQCDRTKERYILTWNPKGYLKRIK